MADASRDNNYVTTLLAVSSTDNQTPVKLWADQTTHRLLVDASGVSVASALTKDVFSSTNGQTTFTPTGTVAFDIYMSLNGSIQTPTTDYTIVAGDYVLNSAIPSGVSVILCYATS